MLEPEDTQISANPNRTFAVLRDGRRGRRRKPKLPQRIEPRSIKARHIARAAHPQPSHVILKNRLYIRRPTRHKKKRHLLPEQDVRQPQNHPREIPLTHRSTLSLRKPSAAPTIVFQSGRYYAGSSTYSYDGIGHRVLRLTSGVTTYYVYDAMGLLADECSNAVNTSPCTTCYLSYDHLGSVRLVTDGNGNIISRHDFLPFGEEVLALASTGRMGPGRGVTDDVKQRFTGNERDTESGLDYFGARYYGSALGRFMSPDWSAKPVPVPYADFSNPQTLNQYA
jgi:RHS repeat-associated protein